MRIIRAYPQRRTIVANLAVESEIIFVLRLAVLVLGPNHLLMITVLN
jgi:hypothetical protein